MNISKLRLLAIALGIFLVVMHIVYGNDIFFPYVLWEVLHFVGGIALGMFFYEKEKSLYKILMSVLLIGVMWEVYEYTIRNIEFRIWDTILDFGLELVGACLAILLLGKTLNDYKLKKLDIENKL